MVPADPRGGFAVVYVPEAQVRHRVSAASGGAGSRTEVLRDAEHARCRRARRCRAGSPDCETRLVVAPRVLLGVRRPASAWAACVLRATTAAGEWGAASLPVVANERSSFYRRILEQLLEDGTFHRDMEVLVVAGVLRIAMHSTRSASST